MRIDPVPSDPKQTMGCERLDRSDDARVSSRTSVVVPVPRAVESHRLIETGDESGTCGEYVLVVPVRLKPT